MPGAFLMQQMAWREALDEAHSEADVQAIDDAVAGQERSLLADIATKLDKQGDPAAAADLVRALMFVRRFRADIGRRLDTFDL